MSLRQIRRLKELADPKSPDVAEELPEDQEEYPKKKPTVFNRLALSESESSSSDESEQPSEHEKAQTGDIPGRGAAPMVSKPKTSRNSKKKGSRKVDSESGAGSEVKTDNSIQSAKEETVKVDIRMLNPSNELRRIFGKEVRSKRNAISKRRHWLIEPAKEWPLVIRDTFRMEVTREGSFRLVPESVYEAKMKILARIVVSHDIEALYQFIQFNPFHVHGLLQLALILIDQRKEYENAFELIRRALFALQSAFMPSFHPDKSVILSPDSLFTTSLLRCLLLYSHLLAGQGCVRTSLEVLKLIYLMEGGMATACPITHALLHLDSAAFRADQFEFLSLFATKNGLADALPGTAFLFALAQKERGIDLESVDSVREKDVRAPLTEKTPASIALIRAALRFPGPIKLAIGRELEGLSRSTDLLTNKLTLAFSSKTVAYVKSRDDLVRWIETVLEKSIPRLANSLARSHPTVNPEWLMEGYGNITSSEFEWGQSASSNFVEPARILETESQILEMYSEDEFVRPRPATSSRGSSSYPVSLESNPVAVFLQTLLPWSRIDHTGTEATPVTAQSLIDRMNETLGWNQETRVIEQADRSSDSQSAGESEEEELEME
jgi:hypothetical protein